LRVVDQNIINQAAIEAGVPRAALEELSYEGRRGLVDRMLSVVYGMPAIPTTLEPSARDASVGVALTGGLLSSLQPPMSLSMVEYVRMVDMAIRELAGDDHVILVGQGGQVVLKNQPGVLHVQVMASFSCRVETLMSRRQLDRRQAAAELRANDHARAHYLRRYHGADWQDPRLYHLSLHTDSLPVPVAVAAVVGACRALDEVAVAAALSQTPDVGPEDQV